MIHLSQKQQDVPLYVPLTTLDDVQMLSLMGTLMMMMMMMMMMLGSQAAALRSRALGAAAALGTGAESIVLSKQLLGRPKKLVFATGGQTRHDLGRV